MGYSDTPIIATDKASLDGLTPMAEAYPEEALRLAYVLGRSQGYIDALLFVQAKAQAGAPPV